VALAAITLVVLHVLTLSTGAQQSPRRIISLVPSATEMLFAMGRGTAWRR